MIYVPKTQHEETKQKPQEKPQQKAAKKKEEQKKEVVETAWPDWNAKPIDKKEEIKADPIILPEDHHHKKHHKKP